jgi:hypothetical protein
VKRFISKNVAKQLRVTNLEGKAELYVRLYKKCIHETKEFLEKKD